LILLAAVDVGAEYGGRISFILINGPGEAASVVSTLGGYPFGRQGFASVALLRFVWFSFIVSAIDMIGILFFSSALDVLAGDFGLAEYFVLIVFAFCALSSLLGEQQVKGMIAALTGLAISTVGVDSNSGVYRYTFDIANLSDGIDFVVVVIGLFAVSEMLQMREKLLKGHSICVSKSDRKLFNLSELRKTWWTSIRGGVIGFVVGVLPGAGASVASAVAYSSERKYIEGRDPDAQFGNGDLRGLVAPEAANNASATGSFIPMLTLGVLGS